MTYRLEVTDKARLTSPYSPAFVDRARKLGGQWDSRGKVWAFDVRDVDAVKAAVGECYGHYFDPVPVVAIRITARIDFIGDRKPVYCGPRVVAQAWGRDSGAKLGTGVVCISGDYQSGGSVKNWDTRVSAGSVFELKDYPDAKLRDIDREHWEVDVLTAATDPDAERIAAMRAFMETEKAQGLDRQALLNALFNLAHGKEA